MSVLGKLSRLIGQGQAKPRVLHCPDCGRNSLRLIENTEPMGILNEFKEVRTCDHCENIVYIVRSDEHPVPGDTSPKPNHACQCRSGQCHKPGPVPPSYRKS